MDSPQKPWERAGVNTQSGDIVGSNGLSSSMPSLPAGPSSSNLLQLGSQPPPVAPRPSQQLSTQNSSYSGYGYGMGSSMGSYGYGGYGSSLYGSGLYGSGPGLGGYGGGMYGGYGSYGMNRYGMYGGTNVQPNSFVQQAEDSSRQAFQSIESIVQAFGSVSMMMESTFYAVYNSFRAVIGVADQFTRMKMHFAQIFSALAVIRTLKWLYHKLLVLLRLRQAGLPEDVWNQAAQASLGAFGDAGGKGSGRSSWPILMFFAITLGGPWVIWKILQSLGGNKDDVQWADGTDDHFVARAEFDFRGQSEEELSFNRGQRIIIAPKELQPRVRGWLLASVDGQKKGFVPVNYVKIVGKRKGKRHAPSDTPVGATANPQVPLGIPSVQEPAWNASLGSVCSSQDLESAFSQTQTVNSLSAAPIYTDEMRNSRAGPPLSEPIRDTPADEILANAELSSNGPLKES